MREMALADRLYPSPSESFGVPGRSIAWKLFLAKDEPLQTSEAPSASHILSSIRISRTKYTALLLEKMKAPDGSYESGIIIPGATALPKKSTKKSSNDLDTNNPLSLHDENPWNAWFASVELRKIIQQDVERTFPEIEFFRDAAIQAQLTNILFLYSSVHEDIGYRQGMHELLAPLYFAVSYDSIPEEDREVEDVELRELCSETWIAADAWSLFEAVMGGVSQWYEWRERTVDNAPSALATHVNLNIPDGQNGIQPYVAPIVKACTRIQSTLLNSTDPQLWKQMQASGIEPQIYGIRWLRLLFTREFNLPDAMKLWDSLFACDPTLELSQWVCVAMLIRIRNELIPADYSNQLTILLRYPSPSSQDVMAGAPHHTSLLIRQALALQMSSTPAAGVSLMIENRNFLNIPLEVPTPPPVQKRGHSGRQQSASAGRIGGDTSSSRGHARQPSSPQMGLPEMIARGLLERGESLGINKTLMSAVSELRRNIPDLASTLATVRTPHQSMTSFPLEDERLSEERPPWEPRTRFEMEREITQLHARDKRLGESLGWIVDALLQDESGAEDKERLKRQKHEALECLSYVRDVLISHTTALDDDRLIGEEEALQRKLRAKKQAEEAAASTKLPPIVSPPAPASVVDSMSRLSNTGRSNRRVSPPPFMTSPVSSGTGQTKFAPWNHTRSSFSNASPAIGSATLPRPPPPTSTSLRVSGKKMDDQTPTSGVYDPLGALK
ncbi:rab-GTPase-TBC domain-containing protein [Crucibulum laeve]|uniref:Rab-GTPase-TBC domain-containing protein n=1 Tax=Crucibulum laeve TaxID=68775 RepID=A0A5C3MN83_9AGAR|nr:rab-GTPase-TBC domain-containing protein [Crucibulum laeve]